MSLSLTDQKVLITGATDGLGYKLALELAKQGSTLILHGRNAEKLENVLGEVKKASPDHTQMHKILLCDFNQPNTIPEAFSKLTEIDILINNAGIWAEGNTIDIAPEKIIELINVNLSSYLLVSRIMLPVLKKSKFAQILNIISVAGYEVPSDYFHTTYSATKYGLQGLSEAMAKEFHNSNLRVMGFYPGGMATKLFEKAGNDYKTKEPWMFDPQESVEAIVFMLTRNPKVSVKRMDLINRLEE